MMSAIKGTCNWKNHYCSASSLRYIQQQWIGSTEGAHKYTYTYIHARTTADMSSAGAAGKMAVAWTDSVTLRVYVVSS